MAEEVGGQAVDRVVGLFNRLVQRFERLYRDDRPEDLLFAHAHIVRNVHQQRGRHVRALRKVLRHLAAHHELRAGLHRVVHQLQHTVARRFVDQRPHDLSFVLPPAELHSAQLLRNLFAQLRIDTLLHINAVIVHARLAREAGLLRHDIRRNLVQIHVRHHDDRRVAAQLEGILLHGRCALAHDLQARLARTDERNELRDAAGVERLSHLCGRAGDDVDDARREADLFCDHAEIERGQRGLARRLDDAAAAGDDCGRDLQSRVAQRVVPRQMADRNAHRAALNNMIAAAIRPCRVGEGRTVDAFDFLRVILEARHAPVKVAAGQRICSAGFPADQLDQRFALGKARFAKLQHPVDARLQRGLRPGLERLRRRVQRLLRLRRIRGADRADDLAGRRVEHVQRLSKASNQFAANILLIHPAYSFLSSASARCWFLKPFRPRAPRNFAVLPSSASISMNRFARGPMPHSRTEPALMPTA